jgi:hypothetical protein
VLDSNFAKGTQNLSITINPLTLVIQTDSLPNALINHSYNQILQATGGIPPYSWTVFSGTLPPGLILNPNGIISGTPTQQWKYAFNAEVKDTEDMKDSRSLSISVVGSSGTIEIPLIVGNMDSRAFGHNYGSDMHETGLTATFEGTSMDLVLSVTGYDIDYMDEISVYLNDQLLGHLSYGPNNSLNSGDSFAIPADKQQTGENRIKFVQKTAGWTWGVTNLLVAESS